MKKVLSILGIVAVVAVAVMLGGRVEPAAGAGGQNTIIASVSDSTGVEVSTTTSVTLLATSTSRQYAVFVNDGYAPVYLAFRNGIAAERSKGIRLSAGASYEIRDVNLYTGAVTAIASSTQGNIGTTTVTVTARQ